MDMSGVIKRVRRFLTENLLLLGTVVGAVSGFLLGLVIKQFQPDASIMSLVGYPGEIFMRSLQLLIIPLIIFSLIAGSSTLNIKTNRKIALRTFVYFLVTSVANAAYGVGLAVVFQPGSSLEKTEFSDIILTEIVERKNTLLDNFLDMGRNIVPNNVFSSLFELTTTSYTEEVSGVEYTKALGMRRGINAIGLIFYSLLFGTVLSLMEENGKQLRDVVQVIDLVNMKIISGLIWLTPFGVMSLIAAKVLEVDDMGKIMSSLAIFILTVAIGLILYHLVIVQIIYFILLRRNPIPFYTGLLPALVTGFATDSSSAALPVTLRCLDNLNVDSRVSHFVVPIGVICNMDGTAMFISTASTFIAQMNGMELGAGDYISICITATAVSIAAAGAPSASLTLMPIVLNAIGAPIQDIGLLFAIDWLCDRMRTTNNIVGDCYAATIIEHWSQHELKEERRDKDADARGKPGERTTNA